MPAYGRCWRRHAARCCRFAVAGGQCRTSIRERCQSDAPAGHGASGRKPEDFALQIKRDTAQWDAVLRERASASSAISRCFPPKAPGARSVSFDLVSGCPLFRRDVVDRTANPDRNRRKRAFASVSIAYLTAVCTSGPTTTLPCPHQRHRLVASVAASDLPSAAFRTNIVTIRSWTPRIHTGLRPIKRSNMDDRPHRHLSCRMRPLPANGCVSLPHPVEVCDFTVDEPLNHAAAVLRINHWDRGHTP